MRPHALGWIEPLVLARSFTDTPLVLLCSGVQAEYSGGVSLLACAAQETITGDTFVLLAERLSTDQAPFDNAWFGYLAYELRHSVERLSKDPQGMMDLPALWMARFGTVFRFDHVKRELVCWSDTPPSLPTPVAPHTANFSVNNLSSNMDREQYLRGISDIIEAIRAGALYQANLTRKFFGHFSTPPDSFALFEALCAASPAPYSAYIRFGNTAILSSSPERFLHMDAANRVSTRPIKGSAKRSHNLQEDTALREALFHSAKDRAENLMIVDLMRNDLSRSCAPGSVQVERLFDVTSHAHVHHMSSTIRGQRRPEISPLQLVQNCFPPGSMTGAPKIRAMELCTALERMERGVYSGALGWFGGDGSLDLSVVIRTLIVQENRFEFQVGGGVVADSTPSGEWEETLVKAAGIAKALGITREALAAL